MPALDLCQPHINEMIRLFTPRKMRGPDKAPRQRKKFIGVKSAKYEAAVLKLANTKERVNAPDVIKATKLSVWNARELLKAMGKAGKIKKHGTGRGCYWAKP